MTLLLLLRNHSAEAGLYPSDELYPGDLVYPGGVEKPRDFGTYRVPVAVLMAGLAFYHEAWQTTVRVAPDSPLADALVGVVIALLVIAAGRG